MGWITRHGIDRTVGGDMAATRTCKRLGPWTEDEDAVIRLYYVDHGRGWDGWARVLPGREPINIQTRANNLGLRRGGGKGCDPGKVKVHKVGKLSYCRHCGQPTNAPEAFVTVAGGVAACHCPACHRTSKAEVTDDTTLEEAIELFFNADHEGRVRHGICPQE